MDAVHSRQIANKEKVCIHQPNLLPRLSVLHKIASSSTWVVLDDVPFARREWQNRARVSFYRRPSTEFWISAPIRKAPRSALIHDIQLVDFNEFKRKVVSSITRSYSASPFYEWIHNYLDLWLARDYALLGDLAQASTTSALQMLGLPIKVTKASLARIAVSERDMRLVSLCKFYGASTYLCGRGGRRYLLPEIFFSAGVQVEFQDAMSCGLGDLAAFHTLSFIDYIARFGPSALRSHFLKGRDWKIKYE